MLRIGKKVLVPVDELNKFKKEQYNEGYADAKKYYKEAAREEYQDRIEELEKASKKKNKQIENLKEDIAERDTRIDVLEDDRDEVRKVVQKEMELADLEGVINTRKELLDNKEAKLKDRETKLGTEEDKRYKEGYADGVADGVRKVSEITAKDREDAMKIAMVAASSHTPVANMKEVMNVSRQLTAGNTDSEDSES